MFYVSCCVRSFFRSPLTCVQALSVCATDVAAWLSPQGAGAVGGILWEQREGLQGLRAGHSRPGAGSAECDARKANFENQVSPKTSNEKMEMSLNLPRISLPQV